MPKLYFIDRIQVPHTFIQLISYTTGPKCLKMLEGMEYYFGPNVPHLVEIGLAYLPKIGRACAPPACDSPALFIQLNN